MSFQQAKDLVDSQILIDPRLAGRLRVMEERLTRTMVYPPDIPVAASAWSLKRVVAKFSHRWFNETV